MGEQVRLTYNYSKADFSYYNPAHEDSVLFGRVVDEDTGTLLAPFIQEGDAYASYDVSHWTIQDVVQFGSLQPLDQVGVMEGLTEISL